MGLKDPKPKSDPLRTEVIAEYLDLAGRMPTKAELAREVYGMNDEEIYVDVRGEDYPEEDEYDRGD